MTFIDKLSVHVSNKYMRHVSNVGVFDCKCMCVCHIPNQLSKINQNHLTRLTLIFIVHTYRVYNVISNTPKALKCLSLRDKSPPKPNSMR